ncbi:MAG TPA: UDP-N-acetylmuramoyl-tripeptide--D-alanyl-D-alanine ligase, partial [Dehalococcoidia bacterium]|nr:UDP-N-acetylmuramoyl-tripeptide--D-alanyl-D-alanine ligase [Dehalococcoidia bacterium]
MADVWEALGSGLIASRTGPATAFARGIIDSRSAQPGDIFFALRGENADGHDFLPQALKSGASAAVVERPVPVTDASLFHVTDSIRALQRLAAYWRSRHDLRVIGVTGSVGKTTAKELIAHVLSRRFRVLKSEANINTEIGIPLTLLQLGEEHQRAVLEMAMYSRGEIALLAEIARPVVGVVTNVGPVHLERLGYMGAIIAAKAELVEALPTDGLAVLNGDDSRTAAFARRTHARALLFGTSPQCDFHATDIQSHGLGGIEFHMSTPSGGAAVRCPLPGRHHVYAALAAAAVALNEGMSLDEFTLALSEARPDLRLTPRPGPNGSLIIDDSYNASPASMLAALDLLSECPGRRIAVLGDMRELGAASDAGHLAVGRHTVGRCDVLIVVGGDARL